MVTPEREPRNNPLAEAGLIGCLMRHPEDVIECATILSGPTAFYHDEYGNLYRVILSMFTAKEPISPDTVVAKCDQMGGKAVPLSLIADCMKAAESGTMVYYARMVLACARLRAVEVAARGILQDIEFTNEPDPLDIAQRAVDALGAIAKTGDTQVSTSWADACEQAYEAMTATQPSVIPTGIGKYDEAFGGFMRGAVTTVMGVPSSGKTTWVLQCLVNALANNESAVIYSNEMNARRIASSMLTQLSGVGVHAKAMFNDARVDELQAVRKAISDSAFFKYEIVDESWNAQQIYTHARLMRDRGRTIAIIDYLQDLPPIPGHEQGEARVGESMRNLKRIARELGMTTIIVTQQDKSSAKTGSRPGMHDGMYSARIEQASDCIVGIWRPHLTDPAPTTGGPFEMDDWRAKQCITECLVLKNKFWRKGNVLLRYVPDRMTFEEDI